MKIVFYEIQDWDKEPLEEAFPEANLFTEALSENSTVDQKTKEVEILSTFINSRVTKEVIDKFPSLKLIATRSTGYDHIDTAYCNQKNIKVANVPEYGSNTVAEHTFALLLSLTRKIYQSVSQSKNLNFEHDAIRGADLFGKTLGIVGMGKIGINVLRMAQGFGMKTLIFTKHPDQDLLNKNHFKYVDFDTLLAQSDAITLHLPLTKETKHIINKENITKIKKGAYLINTARGGLVDTEALVIGLSNRTLAGVGLDVLEEEKELAEEAALLTSSFKDSVDMKTLIFDHILINHPNVLITPHNAFNSVESLSRIVSTTIENIKGYSEGQPINLI